MVSRSRMYYRKKDIPEEDVSLMNEIREVYTEYPFYGYRRIHATLVQRGYMHNRKKTERLMRIAGLQAIYPRKKTSIRNKNHSIFPYLIKNLEIEHSNQVWAIDITYIRTTNGFVYLVCLIDVYSRKIMGWAMSVSLDTSVCLRALQDGLRKHTPKIINSDQGCQFTSQEWINTLKQKGILISMDGKGRWADNIYIERFWRSVKYEAVYLQSFETVKEARVALSDYIEFYNLRRPHQSLDYKTPDQKFELGRMQNLTRSKQPAVDNLVNVEFQNATNGGNMIFL